LTPNIRNVNDELKVYIWNIARINVEIAELKIRIFEQK